MPAHAGCRRADDDDRRRRRPSLSRGDCANRASRGAMRVVVYGSRPDGHANVVAELAADDPDLELVGLIDDYATNARRTVRDLRVLGTGKELDSLREQQDLE